MSQSPFALNGTRATSVDKLGTRTATSFGTRPGRLVIVGSGIKSVGQFTLEAVGEIKRADCVFFAVADPTTEAFILENNPRAIDLYSLYDDEKPRHDTYIQMSEVLLREVRKGYYVVGVFYGHPGVFVNPSHRAIAIARAEGHDAVMYAGVSAEDCLYAEVGVDPSRPGSQTVEATDLLLRNRPLLTHSHVIIFQVGCVGLMGFNFKGFKNVHFPVLVERLEKDYGLDHPVVSFRDSQFRIFNSTVDRLRIGDLYKPEVQKKITGLTTFYLPPKDLRQNDMTMAKRLGLRIPPTTKPLSGPFQIDRPYSDRDKAAVKALDSHVLPKNYKRLRASPHLANAMKELAVDPKSRALFKKAPAAFVATHPYLRPSERTALTSSKTWTIHTAMKVSPADVAAEFVQACLREPTLSQQWFDKVKLYKNGADTLNAWLKSNNYDTTVNEVDTAWSGELGQGLDIYSTTYNTLIGGKVGPLLIISKGTVTFDSVKIKKFTFASSVLSWSQTDGNASTVRITLVVLTDDDGKPLPPGSYIGPMFSGTLADANHVANTAFLGRVGDFPKPSTPSDPPPSSTDGTKLDQYDSTYSTYSKSGGSWSGDADFVVDAPNVTYDGKALQNIKWTNSNLSVSTVDGNPVNLAIYFFYNKPSSSNKTAGNQFFGRRWNAGESPPTDGNFMGQIGQSSNPSSQADASSWQSILKTVGINLAAGVASMVLGHYVVKAITARQQANKLKTEQAEKDAQKAEKDADDSAEAEERVNEENSEVNPEAQEGGPDPGPGPQQSEAEEAEAEAEEAEAEEAEAEEAEAEEAEAEAEAEVEAEVEVEVDVEVIVAA